MHILRDGMHKFADFITERSIEIMAVNGSAESCWFLGIGVCTSRYWYLMSEKYVLGKQKVTIADKALEKVGSCHHIFAKEAFWETKLARYSASTVRTYERCVSVYLFPQLLQNLI